MSFIENHPLVQREGPYRVNGAVGAVKILLACLNGSDSVGVDTPFTAATSAAKKIIESQFDFLKNQLNENDFIKFDRKYYFYWSWLFLELKDLEKEKYLIQLFSKISLTDKKILYRILSHLEL